MTPLSLTRYKSWGNAFNYIMFYQLILHYQNTWLSVCFHTYALCGSWYILALHYISGRYRYFYFYFILLLPLLLPLLLLLQVAPSITQHATREAIVEDWNKSGGKLWRHRTNIITKNYKLGTWSLFSLYLYKRANSSWSNIKFQVITNCSKT